MSNGIANTNISIMHYLIENFDKYSSIYKKLIYIKANMEIKDLQYLTTCLSYWELFEYLKGNDRPYNYSRYYKDSSAIYKEIRNNWDPIKSSIPTVLGACIPYLIDSGILKKIYVYDEGCTNDIAIQAFFYKMYEKYIRKGIIELVDNNMRDVYLSIPECTTIFIENESDFHHILEKSNDNILKKQLFLLSKNRFGNYVQYDDPNFSLEKDYKLLNLKNEKYYDEFAQNILHYGTYLVNLTNRRTLLYGS